MSTWEVLIDNRTRPGLDPQGLLGFAYVEADTEDDAVVKAAEQYGGKATAIRPADAGAPAWRAVSHTPWERFVELQLSQLLGEGEFSNATAWEFIELAAGTWLDEGTLVSWDGMHDEMVEPVDEEWEQVRLRREVSSVEAVKAIVERNAVTSRRTD